MIKLFGSLAELFAPEVDCKVQSIGEAIAALRANFRDFERYLIEAAQSGLHYRVCVNGYEVSEQMINAPIPINCEITIAPIPKGAGNTFRIIAGVALLGLGIAGVGFLGMTSTTLAITGAALLLGALRGKVKSPKDSERDGRRSLIFGGPSTTISEGGRVPIAYGIILVGWVLISQKTQTSFQGG
jgi:predicted phage tail protein